MDTCNKSYTSRLTNHPFSKFGFCIHTASTSTPDNVGPTAGITACTFARFFFLILFALFSKLQDSPYSIPYTCVSWEWIEIWKTQRTRKTKVLAGRSFRCRCHFSLSYLPDCWHPLIKCCLIQKHNVLARSNSKKVTGQVALLRAGARCCGGWSVHISFLMPSDCTLHPHYTSLLRKEETLFTT